VLSYDDPLLYLYTGRRGNRLTLPPRWWYAEDHDAIVGAFRNVVEYCRSRGLQYVYYRPDDGGDEMDQDDRSKIERVVHENPRLEPVFQAGSGTIYRVKP
jgi:hypothetical protein